jgi:DNA-binding transcriptional LysR family regulator
MDLYQLRYFLETARAKSVTRAAQHLHVTPPAVSRSIALLERSLKKRLFSRGKAGVALTAEGEVLRAFVEKAFDTLEQAKLELEGRSAVPALLRIGSREMITNYLLGPSIKAFPKTRFGLHELSPRGMAEALHKDQIDFAFYYHGEIPDSELEIRKLGFLRSHIYAKRPGLPFIAPRYFGADPSEPSMDGYPDQKLPREIRFEGEFLETHRRFVLDGLAAAVLPDFVVKGERLLKLKGPPLGREIYFIKRRARPLPKSVDLFVGILVKTIKRLA